MQEKESNMGGPRDDRAERNRGYASVPLSMVIPRVGNAHLQQNPISDSYSIPCKPCATLCTEGFSMLLFAQSCCKVMSKQKV